MKKIIKKHPKKITMGTLTAVAALVLLLLNIYEKTEAIISKATPQKTENVVPSYLLTDKPDYFNKPASKK